MFNPADPPPPMYGRHEQDRRAVDSPYHPVHRPPPHETYPTMHTAPVEAHLPSHMAADWYQRVGGELRAAGCHSEKRADPLSLLLHLTETVPECMYRRQRLISSYPAAAEYLNSPLRPVAAPAATRRLGNRHRFRSMLGLRDSDRDEGSVPRH